MGTYIHLIDGTNENWYTTESSYQNQSLLNGTPMVSAVFPPESVNNDNRRLLYSPISANGWMVESHGWYYPYNYGNDWILDCNKNVVLDDVSNNGLIFLKDFYHDREPQNLDYIVYTTTTDDETGDYVLERTDAGTASWNSSTKVLTAGNVTVTVASGSGSPSGTKNHVLVYVDGKIIFFGSRSFPSKSWQQQYLNEVINLLDNAS